jgi:hypothetical protein
LQPTMSQTQVGRHDIDDQGSSTEIVGFDDRAVSLLNHYRFVDNSARRKTPPVSWFGFKRTPKPIEVREVTHVSCLRERLDLVCTATATAQCGEANCYSFSWTATFNTF